MAGRVGEVGVGCQEREVVRYADLGDERVDGFELHTGSTTGDAEVGRRGVVVSLGLDEWESTESPGRSWCGLLPL